MNVGDRGSDERRTVREGREAKRSHNSQPVKFGATEQTGATAQFQLLLVPKSLTERLAMPLSNTVVVALAVLCFLAHASAFSVHCGHCDFGLERHAKSGCIRRGDTASLCMGRAPLRSIPTTSQSWFPPRKIYDDDIFGHDEDIEELEERSIALLTYLIKQRILELKNPDMQQSETARKNERVSKITQGRFLDLACTKQGQEVLENLFDNVAAAKEDEDVVRGAVIALQSLLVTGTQVGVKGPPKQLQMMVAHLWRREDDANGENYHQNMDTWDVESIRRLKYRVDQTAGTQVLAKLLRKRTTQGAFELLVEIGAWEKHEDLALLRSGFPVHFTEAEEEAAKEAAAKTHDPDALLGLRKDLRQQKVYTIDSASTTEVDDGLSVEILSNEDGTTRQRLWIHIADAERWAPPDSNVFNAARRRVTSLYLPSRSLPMFPTCISDLMSLKANHENFALSLGVELLPDGSIDSSSVMVTPSRIKVDYRLSYDETNYMLEEGVGYDEEWQLGALLAAAKKRRTHRIENGSTEGMVPFPIPQLSVSAKPDHEAPDGVSIDISVESSHNSGVNQTEISLGDSPSSIEEHLTTVSPASLLVTEMMILAGEAIGKWKNKCDEEDVSVDNESHPIIVNTLRLPFRSQPKPDFKSRQHEVRILNDLLEGMNGGGYCHAWYARRFLKPAQMNDMSKRHFGLGLDCYVQWTSPIRRIADLQVHAAVKRYLRRKRVNELIENHEPIPSELTDNDLGCMVPFAVESSKGADGRIEEYIWEESILDKEINYNEGTGLVKASRILQRKSQEYWVFEYLDRLMEHNPEGAEFDALVLGCVNPEREQYAVYIHELGLEHRYTSEVGALRPGMNLSLRVSSVHPRLGLLTFAVSNL